MYSDTGRRSIPPEKLLRALLLQILYSIRSERMLCEQLDYNLLFRGKLVCRWMIRCGDHSTFSKNRDRLLESDIARHSGPGVSLPGVKTCSARHLAQAGIACKRWMNPASS